VSYRLTGIHALRSVALGLVFAVIGVMFQGQLNRSPNRRLLKRLAYLWIGQTVLLALLILQRICNYLLFNGCTYWKVVGIVGTLTVAAGAAISVAKVVLLSAVRLLESTLIRLLLLQTDTLPKDIAVDAPDAPVVRLLGLGGTLGVASKSNVPRLQRLTDTVRPLGRGRADSFSTFGAQRESERGSETGRATDGASLHMRTHRAWMPSITCRCLRARTKRCAKAWRARSATRFPSGCVSRRLPIPGGRHSIGADTTCATGTCAAIRFSRDQV